MIADARFADVPERVRPLRFVRRAGVPLDDACAVANGVREALRELLGAPCELVLGEPAPLGPEAWSSLAADALLFLSRGRRTDVVLALPRDDARRLVLRAFGEHDAPGVAWSALELRALQRIAMRCAAAFGPLCAEREPPRAIAPERLPACVAYFDVRVSEPVRLTLGVGLAREIAEPPPAAAFPAGALASVALQARAVIAEGSLDAAEFMMLRPGSVVTLDTKVGAPASLNVGTRRLATGVPGVVASRTAFLVRDVAFGAQG